MPRPRFTLRATLVVTSIVCLWCGYNLLWMRQPRAAVAKGGVLVGKMSFSDWMARDGPIQPPGLLRLFGEPGYFRLIVKDHDNWPRRRDQLTSLFPEAEIVEANYSR
jgi:hypothetical protein